MEDAASASAAKGRVSWRDLREEALRRVRSGSWPPGSTIPFEEDLAAEFGCGRGVVNRALQALAAEGVLERRRKGGTRVAEHPASRPRLEIPLLRREIEAKGAVYRHRLLSRALEPAPASVRARLDAAEGAALLRLRALHLADGAPYAYEERWISPEGAPGALEADFAAIGANEWLLRHAPYDGGEMAIGVEAASPEAAESLGLAAGALLLGVERRTWRKGAGGAPIPITLVRLLHAPGYRLKAEL